MNIVTVGIDLAKDVVAGHGMDATGNDRIVEGSPFDRSWPSTDMIRKSLAPLTLHPPQLQPFVPPLRAIGFIAFCAPA